MTCDPQELITAATPIQCCIPAGMQPSVFISLLCQIRDNGGGGGGVTAFTQLTDTFPSYAGRALQVLRVNAGQTGIESVSLAASTVTKFTSGNITLDGGTTEYIQAHGLGSKPAMLRVVLVCIAPDASTGDVAGIEIDVSGVFNTVAIINGITVRADATNVYISCQSALVGSELDWQWQQLAGAGAVNPSSFNNFAFKIYAWL